MAALMLLASVTGFAFAGTGLEDAPESAAATTAAYRAAERVAAGVVRFPPAAAQQSPQPLLADADHVRTDAAPTRVRIAAIGLDAEVRAVGYVLKNGALQYDVPRVGAGYYAGSTAPGQTGNTVIAGHVSTRSGPAVFRELPGVKIGQVAEVFSGGEIYRYLITEIRVVAPEATAVMGQTQDATLTLITCFPNQSFAKRFVVIGKRM